MNKHAVILASQSPRRKMLLAHLIDDFTVQAADIDESVLDNETPSEYVSRLSLEKAQHIFKNNPDAIVVGSDTSVVINDCILGKPADLQDCINILSLLSGKQHQVVTAFTVMNKVKMITKVVVTHVLFKTLTQDEIIKYWHTGEPQDKAGSYAIQGIGGKFVKTINGSVSSVVGLPLVEIEQALKEVME
ncbi:Maf family protein [Psychrosphaera aquimarina]|uniref:dTTP/UTP pyrophosphatase n=1 Tax=Psychrosphaera aquimarina TaxID=2044854 RepID=A0ABU3R229_9GAMM|nr:Maf family protein [Psychrosphaera aquimarina]MDU0113722.1 Maf family protein [Psychrosphaera aquimarina]